MALSDIASLDKFSVSKGMDKIKQHTLCTFQGKVVPHTSSGKRITASAAAASEAAALTLL
jgi:hypothetical protein